MAASLFAFFFLGRNRGADGTESKPLGKQPEGKKEMRGGEEQDDGSVP